MDVVVCFLQGVSISVLAMAKAPVRRFATPFCSTETMLARITESSLSAAQKDSTFRIRIKLFEKFQRAHFDRER